MMLEKVAQQLGRKIYETPVGFKWFVDGLVDGSLGFVCEESAGASLLRRDGSVWTTDKDGIALALLAGEITARQGKDPSPAVRRTHPETGATRHTSGSMHRPVPRSARRCLSSPVNR